MECCWIDTKYLDHCNKEVKKGSFFCSKHKPLLYEVSDFSLFHGGNAKKIVEDGIIKTAKELGIPGIGARGNSLKDSFDQVFFALSFPGRDPEEINHFIGPKIKKEDQGYIEIDIKILEALSKLDKSIHFNNTYALGGFNEEYSIEYNPDYSLKENLNHIYYFIIKENETKYYKNWKKQMKKSLTFEQFREKVLDFGDDYANELVISGSVPLTIKKKDYLKNVELL
jgi:hypothetical protein